ncbi:MAG TPA: YkvA family protein [Candidatus Saccharimonadia bacterium]|nr:YkvA family protein [Candidatus Saccharimonadia bacterium]
MRVTFELEPCDIERFHEARVRAHDMARCADESDIVAAAKQALDALTIGAAPGYVRKRIVMVQRLILMLEDESWALPKAEREDVAETLVYFSDPEDMIPDDLSVIGLLDDAIMLELLLKRMRHVLQAYDEFCARRALLRAGADGRVEQASALARRRATLQDRMRRRARRGELAAL